MVVVAKLGRWLVVVVSKGVVVTMEWLHQHYLKSNT